MTKSISDIKIEIEHADMENVFEIISKYKNDSRSGVQKLIQRYENQQKKMELEYRRLEQLSVYEKQYENYGYIGGIDEVGRGPFAGPVVASVVILPKGIKIPFIDDSKKLNEKKREELYEIIKEQAIDYGVGIVSPQIVDEINILQATYMAMRIALSELKIKPNVILNDAVTIPEVDENILQCPIIKGDSKSISIAAASIIAKVTRDRMMKEYAKKYPEYEFESNKGYGSAKHIEILKKIGPCEIHRRSFIRNFCS